MFTEMPFEQRFTAAASAGFEYVEWNYAFDFTKERLRNLLEANSLALTLINVSGGDMSSGELGLAALPGRQADAAAAFAQALDYATALDARLVHFLAGKPPPGMESEAADAVFLENLCQSADIAASAGVTLTLEPLNPRDRAGYHLMSATHATRLIRSSQRSNIKLQLDVYHQQMHGGNVLQTIEENFEYLAHVQLAGVPGRHEPDTGELNHTAILSKLDELGYTGVVGCEYAPIGRTSAGLNWAQPYLNI
ncbi:hydroxypyruvate isomerase family protein [Amycolatopsis pithecellobii]|nr:TIM barrel protein [Amycolatopsis pithecellobii]